MRKKVVIAIIFCFYIFIPALFCDVNKVIVQSGHIGAVNQLVHHPDLKLLFSGGEDGTVKIWNSETRELLRSIRVYYRPVTRIAIHPTKPYCAVLEIQEPLAPILSVWDWETGEKKYKIEMKQIPLFFSFSTKGTYLIYGKPEWNSLSFHNAESGASLSIFDEGFGLVSYITCSKTEKNIMTYQPSGKIMYWDIKSGKQLLTEPVSTLPNLTAISISNKKTFIAGSAGNKLVVVDLLSGKVVAQRDIRGILATAISPDGKEILSISRDEEESVLERFSFNGNEIKKIPGKIRGPYVTELTTPVYGPDTLFFSAPDGTILMIDNSNSSVDSNPYSEKNPVNEYTSLSVFSRNELVTISDIALTKKLIAIGNEEKILSFPLHFLDTGAENVDISDFNYNLYENMLRTDIGLSFFSSIKLLTWSRNSEPVEFNIRNIRTGEIIEEFGDFSSPLIQLQLLDNGIITLERDGLCAVRDIMTFQSQFEYKAKGLNKIVYVSDSQLIGARSKLNKFESPLISINPHTGETVPLSDPALLCYDLAFQKRSASLYSLSIGSNSSPVTQFKIHRGDGFEREHVLFSFDGEDLSASLVTAPSGDYVYTSLGYNRIMAWDGSRVKEFPECPHLPRKLYVSDKLLLSLNRDQSISIWDRFKQERMLDLYLFRDYTWVAVLANGEYVKSEGGAVHVRDFKD